ncbi:MAG: hypothetical protein K2X11_15885 [Acetobacteraceae bacterium]|nr:hypothetical protein [Acetobacteraceae bacterium]
MFRWLALFLLIAGPAAAQSALDAAAAFPPSIAGFERREVTDFENRPGGQGLGAAAEYRPRSGPGVATVYLYDRGRSAIGEAEVAEELTRAEAEARQIAQMRQFTIGPARPVAGLPGMRCLAFELSFPQQRADSFACVGAWDGRFVKLRMTLPAAPGSETTMRQFLAELAAR